MANPANEIPGKVNGSMVTCETKTVSKKSMTAFIRNDAKPNVIILRGIERSLRTGLSRSIMIVKIMPVTIYVCTLPESLNPDKSCVVIKREIV